MIDESTMYWITRLDALHSVLQGLSIVSGIIGAVVMIVFLTAAIPGWDTLDEVTAKVVRRRSGIILAVASSLFLIFLFAWALTPTTREYAAIKLIPAVVNNSKVQDEAKDLYDLVKDWLKDKVKEEVTPEKKSR
jgi:predicted PurR-regulated permease PerM